MSATDIRNIFSAAPRSLSEFLGVGDQGCYIPSYQRAYSWDVENVARLLEDAAQGLQRLVDQAGSLSFLGTVIAVDNKSVVPVAEPMDRELPDKVMTIIDGQQRLCTLLVINILVHAALVRIQAEAQPLADCEWLLKELTDYLPILERTFRFESKRVPDVYRFYPRIIRSEDQWARHREHAVYTTPIAHFTWSYIQHLESGKATPFEYPGAEADADAQGHQALKAVIDYLRTAIGGLEGGEHEDIRLPEAVELVDSPSLQVDLWPFKFPKEAAEGIRGGSATVAIRALRLMAFARYLNTRMAITLVTTTGEDYAFDMFEALNTTGQPLTAIETFRPKVVDAEGADFKRSRSSGHLDEVAAFLDTHEKAEKRQKATTQLLIPFALYEEGRRLEGHLSAQRRYLRGAYESIGDIVAKRTFTSGLAAGAAFLRNCWSVPAKEVATFPGMGPVDEVAGFCFEALRDLKHDIVIAPLLRFHVVATSATTDRNVAAAAFSDAVKAVTAFSMLWRAGKGGTANVDGIYRELMAKGLGGPPLCRRTAGTEAPAPSIDMLRSALRGALTKAKLDKDDWVKAAAQQAIYKTNKTVTRFLLFVASHDAMPDEAAPGLVKPGRKNTVKLLTAGQWRDDATLTIEHVASESSARGKWSEDIYKDARLVHQLGNLMLMPELENGAAADHGWDHKHALYGVYASRTAEEAKSAIVAAKKKGISVPNIVEELIETSAYLPMCRAVSEFSGPWNAAFIARRSQRLSELAWDRLYTWLEAPVAASPITKGRRSKGA